MTWARDGSVYASWGDGAGFAPSSGSEAYTSIGVARLTGSSAGTLRGENLVGGYGPRVAPCILATAEGLVQVQAACCARGGRSEPR